MTGPEKFVLLRRRLRAGISLAGHARLKIYERLDCAAGKRMLGHNRVYFFSKEEAEQLGFRPCARCLPAQYKSWKASISLKL